MSTILEILDTATARLRRHVDDTAAALAALPTSDELDQARAVYTEQVAEAQRKLAETEQRIADRRRAEEAYRDAQRALAEAVELAARHRRTVEVPPEDAVASTGLPTPAPAPVPADGPVAAGPAETMPDTTPVGRLPFRLGTAMGPARPTPGPTGPDDTPPMTTHGDQS